MHLVEFHLINECSRLPWKTFTLTDQRSEFAANFPATLQKLLPHTHFLHHISEQCYCSSLIQTSLFWKPIDVFLMCFCLWGRVHLLFSFHSDSNLGKHLCNVLMLLTSPKQNSRKSRHGISLAGNPAVTRGGDVRRKCPGPREAGRQSDRHVGRASLFLPGISYQFSLMSVQVAETNSKHPSPLISFTSTGSLLF